MPSFDLPFSGVADKTQDRSTVRRVQEYIDTSAEVVREYHKRHEDNNRFVSALKSQWDKEDRAAMTRPGMPPVTPSIRYGFVVNHSIAGSESTKRFSPRIVAPDDEDGDWSRVLNAVLRRNRAGGYGIIPAEKVESRAFKSTAMCGLGCLRSRTSYRNRLIPHSTYKHIRVNNAWWDTNAQEMNFNDTEWRAVRTKISPAKFKRQYSDYKGRLKEILTSGRLHVEEESSQTGGSRPFVYQQVGMQGESNRDDNITITYLEDRINKDVIVARMNGQEFEFTRSEFQSILPGIQQFDESGSIEIFETKRDRYRFYLLANSVLLDSGDVPENCFTISFITGFLDESDRGVRYFGAIDIIRDPQKIINKLWSLNLIGIAGATKNSFFLKHGSLQNVEEAEQKLTQGGFIPIDDMDERPVPVERSNFPTGEVLNSLQMAQGFINVILGIDPYRMGGVGETGSLSRTSGKALAQVEAAGIQVLSELFDSLEEYKREAAYTELMKMNFHLDEESVARLVGNELTEFIRPKAMWGEAIAHDVDIENRPVSSTEKKELWSSLMQTDFAKEGLAIGLFPPEFILEKMPGVYESDLRKIEEWKKKQAQEAAASAAPPPDNVAQMPQR